MRALRDILAGRSLIATGSRFALTGLGATMTYVIASNLLLSWGLPSASASVLGYLAGMGVSFFGHKRLTFNVKGRIGTQWSRFLVLSAFGLAVSYAGMRVGAEVLGWRPVHVTLAIAVLVPVVNFFIMRFWVFVVAS